MSAELDDVTDEWIATIDYDDNSFTLVYRYGEEVTQKNFKKSIKTLIKNSKEQLALEKNRGK